ncbi:MAG TPA: hypothetical protein VHW01_19820, partial [Polyangiaceae bacterium]|nr:hypothetical protein [Polyangiaceae bacterium]
MTKRISLFSFLGLVVIAFSACDEPGPNSDVGTAPACTAVDLTLFLPPTIVSAPFEVRGTIDTPSDDAIESVIVAGHAATADGFNFRTFSVSLDASELAALPRFASGSAKTSPSSAGEGGIANSGEDAGAVVIGFPVLIGLTANATCSVPPQLHTAVLALSNAAGAGGSTPGGAGGTTAAGAMNGGAGGDDAGGGNTIAGAAGNTAA